MTAVTLVLPRLAGSRELARAIVGQEPDLAAADRVFIEGRRLVSGSPSFADELVKAVSEVTQSHHPEVTVLGAQGTFERYLRTAAIEHGVELAIQHGVASVSA